ncbi:MAG TPA: hypothetical protein DCE42_00330 [Myxococcales bacterium]|nr:hypothetical protein [Deltaproteobacteria bacterium]MBU49895.1 hypothetical protein [Deltaproteobacteria bacterium]HAA53165.1 hypothetical protein [Myxococcales bacterium]
MHSKPSSRYLCQKTKLIKRGFLTTSFAFQARQLVNKCIAPLAKPRVSRFESGLLDERKLGLRGFLHPFLLELYCFAGVEKALC